MMNRISDIALRLGSGSARLLAIGLRLALTGYGDSQPRHRRSVNGMINALAVSALFWTLMILLVIFA